MVGSTVNLQKTATERVLEAAERAGVRVTVRKSTPGSGMIIVRPGVGPGLHGGVGKKAPSERPR